MLKWFLIEKQLQIFELAVLITTERVLFAVTLAPLLTNFVFAELDFA